MTYMQQVQHLVQQAKDYPTKSIIKVAIQVYEQQQQRIQQRKAQLDGEMWNPSGWK